MIRASAAKASIRTGENRWKCTLRLANSIERVEDALADGAITVVTGRQLLTLLALERLRLLGSKPCRCKRPAPSVDPDGDLQCARCGHFLGHVAPRINGYDSTARMIELNGRDVDSAQRHKDWARFAGVAA